MKQHLFITTTLFAVCLCIASCDKEALSREEPTPEQPTEPVEQSSKCIYYDTSLPSVMPAIPQDDFIGYSYKLSREYLFGIALHRVIDIDKFKQANPDYISRMRMNQVDGDSYVFSNFDGYTTKKLGSKVSSKYSVNFDRLDEWYKEHYSRIAQTDSEANHVFGETWFEYHYDRYNTIDLPNVRKTMAQDYLTPRFIEDLYTGSMSDVLNEYGLFVIMSYYSGNCATIRYAREETKPLSDVEKEVNMSKLISDTFYQDENKEVAFRYSHSSDRVPLAEKSNYGVTLIGGEQQPPGTRDINDWLQNRRFKNEKDYVLVGFPDNGLSTLADIVLEENFAQRIIRTHNGNLPAEPVLRTPYIAVGRTIVKYSDPYLFDILPVLHTRQGDRIAFRSNPDQPLDEEELRLNNNPEVYAQKCEVIKAQKAQYFDCDIEILEQRKNISPMEGNRLTMVIPAIDESRMRKFTNPNTNICYLYDPVSRVALAYLDKPDIAEYILDAYGITDWVNSLPEEPVKMRDLSNQYKIIGL